MESLEKKSVKFEGAASSYNSIVIKLESGPGNISKAAIENQILYEYASHPERMNVIAKVHVYDAVTNNIITTISRTS